MMLRPPQRVGGGLPRARRRGADARHRPEARAAAARAAAQLGGARARALAAAAVGRHGRYSWNETTFFVIYYYTYLRYIVGICTYVHLQ